ncbi:protein TIC 62 chloroplastic isoform X1 [Tripterygium wilfordii]|uniref:Protein TIC 62 chloroplastic isoform X1 n=1 Tax=Tripterygium wilfordii TaxID=458696 RepID=A0A7J7DH14_TRIWF|nr:protein TIC 62, chloroplastic isoform X2 [Tripterygium wilfordii]KAF5745641.1 protein TIC 62 chloroplastic isoform X1 [Tripterygium wilfordii]
MECCSVRSPPIVTIIPSSLPKSGFFIEKHFVHGQVLKYSNSKSHSNARNLKHSHTITARQVSGIAKISSIAVEAVPKTVNTKDENLAFVAGSTGRVGSRTVKELLKLGFKVRAGVRSAQKAESLVQSVKEMKLDIDGTQSIDKLEIVECDLEKRGQIGPALGNASIVICCIGASEKEVFDVTGPYRIDYQAAKNLVDAATDAKVKHFILVSSLGTNKVGFPAAILNLFWGVLIWKRKAEEALLASGIPYTIVRPGGMERPTDSYKETHNMNLSEEDTLFGGQVSNLQVAELMAFMAKNRSLSYCKVVEVIAETTVPLTPMEKLLAKIPSQRIEPKDSDAASESQPVPPKSVVSGAASTVEEEPFREEVVVTRQPFSPYTAYEDLKPPSSPSPTPSGAEKISEEVPSPSNGGNNVPTVTVSGVSENDPSQNLTSNNSPFLVYDDMKPPTSPTPNQPDGTLLSTLSQDGSLQMPTMSGNDTSQPLTADIPVEKQHHNEPKPRPRPLSPFTMYEDLKPPTSPMPSPGKSK